MIGGRIPMRERAGMDGWMRTGVGIRTNRRIRIIGIVVLFLAGAATATAQFRPVVQIDPLQNASGQTQLDALGTAIVDGIAFTLRLIGDYEVRTGPVPAGSGYDEESLATRALEEEVNNVVFGEIAGTDDGTYLVTIAAYDQGVDAVVFEDSVRFDSLFDAFDIVDGITVSLVEGFSGVRLTFGTVRFVVPSGEAPVTIRLGEVDLFPETTLVERVPTGEHVVTVSQERPLGRYEYEEQIAVVAEETTEVAVSIPEVSPDEAAILDAGVAAWQSRLLAEIERSDGVDGDGVDGDGVAAGSQGAAVDEALALLESEYYRTFRGELAERYRGRFSGSDDASLPLVIAEDDPLAHLRRSGTMPNWLNNNYSVAGRFARSVPVRETITAHAAYPGYGGSNRRLLPFRRITVDGSDGDWEGISGFKDTTGDMRPGIIDTYEATDLVEVRVAYDADYLYLMYRTADQTYERRNTGYKFHFDMASGARVYLDIWPYQSGDRVWAGYTSPDRDGGVEWNNLEAGIRVALTNGSPRSVLEVAVPLEPITDWRYFNREMGRIWVASEYIKSGDHSWVDAMEGISAMPFPTRALMLVE
ncbi:MAG: hypothetical protein ACOCYQ_01695 [Alkalispirochaeta sp.]